MEPRTCPHCMKSVAIDCGFHFDENLNMIHTECGKILFSTVADNDYAAANVARSRYDYRNYWDGKLGTKPHEYQQLTYQHPQANV
jgi:hypothetical protein